MKTHVKERTLFVDLTENECRLLERDREGSREKLEDPVYGMIIQLDVAVALLFGPAGGLKAMLFADAPGADIEVCTIRSYKN